MTSSPSDTVYGITTPSTLVKELRTKHGLSQRELAYRAGTSQAAIARIENGDEDITWKRLTTILSAMGDRPTLGAERLPHRYDVDYLMRDRAMSPEARLLNAIEFNRFGSELAIAGAKAKAKARAQDAAA